MDSRNYNPSSGKIVIKIEENEKPKELAKKVEFQPLKVAENRYVFQLYQDDKPVNKFIQWIRNDLTPMRVCLIGGTVGKEIASHCWSEDECQAHCNWINEKILNKEIE